jgi:hypothetical protein
MEGCKIQVRKILLLLSVVVEREKEDWKDMNAVDNTFR